MEKKIGLLFAHFPVWIVALWVAYFFSADDIPVGHSTYVELSTLVTSIWFLGSFYLFYSCLIPRFLEKGRTKKFWIYSAIFVFIIIPFLDIILLRITQVDGIALSDVSTKHGLSVWLVVVGGTFFCGMLGIFYRFAIDWFYHLHFKKELENSKLQSELNALKSRLNPHFLFNTLNNIDTLIHNNPEKASDAMAKLSDLLRCVVYETQRDEIPIQKELNTIRKYVDLELLRTLNPDSVSFKNDVTSDFLIPPMLFMPFIDNAFKYSDLNNPKGKILISFSENSRGLVFQCVNSIMTNTDGTREKGVGLELAEKRLKLLYPDKYHLNIVQQNNEYVVLLKIDKTDD